MTRLFHVDEKLQRLWSCLLSIRPSWTAIVPKHPSFIRFNPILVAWFPAGSVSSGWSICGGFCGDVRSFEETSIIRMPTRTVISRPKPSRMDLIPDLTGLIKYAKVSSQGGFGDVCMGTFRPNGERVAVKILRTLGVNKKKKLERRLRREINVWARCRHNNVVQLLGKALDFPGASTIGMVSPWMTNGDLNKYLEQHASSLPLVNGFNIDVRAGLSYLHSKDIIHGDLNGGNILLKTGGTACLTDFGLSTIRAEFQGTSYWSYSIGGAIRWRATELFLDDPLLTKECDIYSFGCVMLQILSSKVPYYDINVDLRVAYEKFQGHLPRRPMAVFSIQDAHWDFITWCLRSPPTRRPNLSEIRDRIAAFQSG